MNYRVASNSHSLLLDPYADTPEVLKVAITLMLFSDDPDIRNFNGNSILMAFSTIPESGFDGINFYLTVAAARIRNILKSRYPDVSDVYFENASVGSNLTVKLNVVQNKNTESVVVYERDNNDTL